jgi:hypothetical protein
VIKLFGDSKNSGFMNSITAYPFLLKIHLLVNGLMLIFYNILLINFKLFNTADKGKRLSDIANVLSALNLVEKVHTYAEFFLYKFNYRNLYTKPISSASF